MGSDVQIIERCKYKYFDRTSPISNMDSNFSPNLQSCDTHAMHSAHTRGGRQLSENFEARQEVALDFNIVLANIKRFA
jgi:hypothetical protein